MSALPSLFDVVNCSSSGQVTQALLKSVSNGGAFINASILDDRTMHISHTFGEVHTAAQDVSVLDLHLFAPAPAPWSSGVAIQSQETGLCLDLQGLVPSNGALLQLWECSGSKSQRWDFVEGQLV